MSLYFIVILAFLRPRISIFTVVGSDQIYKQLKSSKNDRNDLTAETLKVFVL
jgi:hypothetical protein